MDQRAASVMPKKKQLAWNSSFAVNHCEFRLGAFV